MLRYVVRHDTLCIITLQCLPRVPFSLSEGILYQLPSAICQPDGPMAKSMIGSLRPPFLLGTLAKLGIERLSIVTSLGLPILLLVNLFKGFRDPREEREGKGTDMT